MRWQGLPLTGRGQSGNRHRYCSGWGPQSGQVLLCCSCWQPPLLCAATVPTAATLRTWISPLPLPGRLKRMYPQAGAPGWCFTRQHGPPRWQHLRPLQGPGQGLCQCRCRQRHAVSVSPPTQASTFNLLWPPMFLHRLSSLFIFPFLFGPTPGSPSVLMGSGWPYAKTSHCKHPFSCFHQSTHL